MPLDICSHFLFDMIQEWISQNKLPHRTELFGIVISPLILVQSLLPSREVCQEMRKSVSIIDLGLPFWPHTLCKLTMSISVETYAKLMWTSRPSSIVWWIFPVSEIWDVFCPTSQELALNNLIFSFGELNTSRFFLFNSYTGKKHSMCW